MLHEILFHHWFYPYKLPYPQNLFEQVTLQYPWKVYDPALTVYRPPYISLKSYYSRGSKWIPIYPCRSPDPGHKTLFHHKRRYFERYNESILEKYQDAESN